MIAACEELKTSEKFGKCLEVTMIFEPGMSLCYVLVRFGLCCSMCCFVLTAIIQFRFLGMDLKVTLALP